MDYDEVTEASNFESTSEPDFGPQEDTSLSEFVDGTTETPLDDCDKNEILLDEFTFYWFFYSVR